MASRSSSTSRSKSLRSQPVEPPPGRSASTGGLTDKGLARNSMNSRSSNSGRQAHGDFKGKKSKG